MNREVLVEARHLTKIYAHNNSWWRSEAEGLKAVDDVNIKIYRGETLGIVGESGCGKSTLGKMLVRWLEPSGGQIFFEGSELTRHTERQLRQKMQIIFQDPYSSLNPWMTLGELVTEPAEIHQLITKAQRAEYAKNLLEKVGLGAYDLKRYPHQFSGGQRQRICIARALSVRPEFILCDEPVSALDVSIQSQILNLLMDLQSEMGLTYAFISHSFPVIRNLADRVAVMYLGRIVELAPAELFFAQPLHPYSHMLLSAVLVPDPLVQRQRPAIKGEAAEPQIPHDTGCAFYQRCPQRAVRCAQEMPLLQEAEAGHLVACHCYANFSAKGCSNGKTSANISEMSNGDSSRID